MVKIFQKNMLNLLVYGDGYHGNVDAPSYTLVKDLRSLIAARMDEVDEEVLELRLKGRKLPLEKKLEDVNVLNGSRIVVINFRDEEKKDRVEYMGKKRNGQYNQLYHTSDESSYEEDISHEGILINKVKRFQDGGNSKLREKLQRKFAREVSTIDFIMYALKMYQATSWRKTFRMAFAYAMSVLILVCGYGYFWHMYKTGVDMRNLPERMEEAANIIAGMESPIITFYEEEQTVIYTGLPDWAKELWPSQPDDTDFVGQMSYDDMYSFYERFKSGYQPFVTLLGEFGESLKVRVFLCRENKDDLDLYCYMGTVVTTIEVHCKASDTEDENICILTGPYNDIMVN